MDQFNVTFNFDSETKTVSDLKCSVNGVEKKKKTTKKLKDMVVCGDDAALTLEENKLVFNSKAVELLNLSPDDRIVIKYQALNKIMIPIIGKDVDFNEEGTGNKVTKSFTVTYRGKANTILAEHGKEFAFEPHSDSLFKLVSTSESSIVNTVSEPIEKLIELADKIEPEIIVDSNEEPIELDESLILDTLKFSL